MGILQNEMKIKVTHVHTYKIDYMDKCFQLIFFCNGRKKKRKLFFSSILSVKKMKKKLNENGSGKYNFMQIRTKQ